jgi:hypothetical protein
MSIDHAQSSGSSATCTASTRFPAIHIPTLNTLDQQPSWVNRAGRVDRSACVELRAGDIWRDVPKDQWRSLPSPIGRGVGGEGGGEVVKRRAFARTNTLTPALSHRKRGKTRSHREAHATFTIDARRLARLHDTRLPQQLAGDFRTRKSNAMRSHIIVDHVSFAANPNRGATRCKKLGLWSGREPFYSISPTTRDGWAQMVRIERWRLHEKLAQHFLICPRCKRKYLKLFLVLVREEEMRDAHLAEGWINMFDALRDAPGSPGSLRTDRRLLEFRAKLINRYGLLFRDRGLLCKKCLNIRYGEVNWQRQAASDARRSARHQQQRAAHDAQVAALREAQRARELETIRQAMPPAALEAEMRTLQALRLERARKDRENARRRERRRRRRCAAT